MNDPVHTYSIDYFGGKWCVIKDGDRVVAQFDDRYAVEERFRTLRLLEQKRWDWNHIESGEQAIRDCIETMEKQ